MTRCATSQSQGAWSKVRLVGSDQLDREDELEIHRGRETAIGNENYILTDHLTDQADPALNGPDRLVVSCILYCT